MAEQSGRKLASAHPQKGTQDAAFQEPRFSTKVPFRPRRRLQHFQRSASSNWTCRAFVESVFDFTLPGLAGHLWRAFSILRCPPFELKRADEVERRMAADGIVEAVDVTADCARGFDPALEDGAPDEFGLEGLEERLDHGVVEAVSLARHRDRDAVLSQLSLVLDGAVLAATVRVVNEADGRTPHGDGPA